ncbi:MAG: DUF1549 and DUF1553 domain-containing protein [Gemmataceae bacterium]|nr:DUF1549 and DUF1553 domain-containing protein [Gemmataceae bacterium]MDW8266271.1 DUF1553 domain-containing protein [Gemmataceae bacterium]
MRASAALALGLCLSAIIPVQASEPAFGREVVPLLYKLGCSGGQCHGAFAGRGNFRLSLFASDPEADIKEVIGPLGRRVNPQRPDDSLLLLKPTGRVPHGGGVRLLPHSDEYRLLREWIAAGAPFDPAMEVKVRSIRFEPPSVVVSVGDEPVSVRVVAHLADGRELDVTRLARFEAYDPSIATVSATGQIRAERDGDASVLAHYAGEIAYTLVLVPRHSTDGLVFPDEPLTDPIDRMIVDKLRKLNVVPSGLCSDAEFLRRAWLDITGQLPPPHDVRRFLADTSPDKRSRKIDELLQHPLHAAVWATKLCDITGADNRVMYDKAVCEFHDWYRNKLERNVPWDEIVKGVIGATTADYRSIDELRAEEARIQEERKRQAAAKKTGTEAKPEKDMQFPDDAVYREPWRHGYGTRNTLDTFFLNNKFRVQAGPDKGKFDPKQAALHVATAFLGVRLDCAECHKHPHDRWTQADFFGFAAAFSYLGRGVDPALRAQNIQHVNGIYPTTVPVITFLDPKTGEPVPPKILGSATIEVKAGVDPRLEVWRWMVSRDNPYFARAIVNRVWAHYFGRGLVDPVDALSFANPPSHPDVLDDLVRDFIEHRYDLRHLHRRILNTRAYQRSWQTNVTNAKDERNLSRRTLRRLSAEQVLDALAQATGTPIDLKPVYSGDPNRKFNRSVEFPLSRPGGADAYVLKIFDKPQRTQSCDCERAVTPNLSQALYFYNDAALIERITHPEGRLAKLLAEISDDDRLLEELYLATLSRLPSEAERKRSIEHLKSAQSRAEGFEDLFWSLLNRREFLVNH